MDMDGLAGICVGAAAERETCAGQILLWTTWLRSGQNPLPGDTYSESGCAARHRFPLITHSPSLGPSQGFSASRTLLRAPTDFLRFAVLAWSIVYCPPTFGILARPLTLFPSTHAT